MTTSKGTIQGYNCQTASDEKHQIVIAAQAVGVGQDQTALKPMIEEIKNQLSTIKVEPGKVIDEWVFDVIRDNDPAKSIKQIRAKAIYHKGTEH